MTIWRAVVFQKNYYMLQQKNKVLILSLKRWNFCSKMIKWSYGIAYYLQFSEALLDGPMVPQHYNWLEKFHSANWTQHQYLSSIHSYLYLHLHARFSTKTREIRHAIFRRRFCRTLIARALLDPDTKRKGIRISPVWWRLLKSRGGIVAICIRKQTPEISSSRTGYRLFELESAIVENKR